MILLSIICT